MEITNRLLFAKQTIRRENMNKKFTTYIENIKNFKIGPITFINIIILLAVISFALWVGSNAFLRATDPMFNPINGDYQTYNGIRRLLSGQIPFKGFYYYLGFGPLYITSILTALSWREFSIFSTCYTITTIFFIHRDLFFIRDYRKV